MCGGLVVLGGLAGVLVGGWWVCGVVGSSGGGRFGGIKIAQSGLWE